MLAERAAGFTTRRFASGDEEPILDLFARSFHAPRSREHFDWKYRQNPFGNERISLTWDEEARLVGHYAGYPVPFREGERDLLAHQIGDTMTATSVRHVGRGPTSILGRTAGHFYRDFCDGVVAFNYGFNVSNIQRFSLRFLRSDRVEPVTYRVRDLRLHPFEPIARWQRWMRGYRLELVTQMTGEWDQFFERVAPAYRFLVRRDAAYLQWRYLDAPAAPYVFVAIRKLRQLAGWIVFRIDQKTLTLGDALFDARYPDAPIVMLRHMVAGYEVEKIEAWFPRRPPWFDSILGEVGLEIRPEPQDLSLMCVPFTEPGATTRMREALYYSKGDSDLF